MILQKRGCVKLSHIEGGNVQRWQCSLNEIKTDPFDNRVLECALEVDAGFIVSGDSDLLNLESFKNIKIVSPAEFLKILSKLS